MDVKPICNNTVHRCTRGWDCVSNVLLAEIVQTVNDDDHALNRGVKVTDTELSLVEAPSGE